MRTCSCSRRSVCRSRSGQFTGCLRAGACAAARYPGFVAVALAVVGLWPRSGSRTTDTSGSTDGSSRTDGSARIDEWGRTATSGIAHEPATEAVATIAYALGLLIAFDISLGYHG